LIGIGAGSERVCTQEQRAGNGPCANTLAQIARAARLWLCHPILHMHIHC
jgi:hypothetical protein